MLNDVTVFNIREYLSSDDKILGEEQLQQVLSEFLCYKNTDAFSNGMRRKIARVSEQDEETGTYTLSAYLIAQLGKNYANNANAKITGEQLLQAAIDTIKELQYMAGGMVVFLESEDKEKLMHFYEKENGFKRFSVRQVQPKDGEDHMLVQLLKVL